MPEMIRALPLIALLSCGGRSQPAPARPAEAEPASAPSSVPADAAPSGPLYRYGKLRTPAEDDRYTCRATAAQIASCTGACALMPPVKYWDGELRCSGVELPPPNRLEEEKRLAALAIPACECSCDAGYQAASEAYRKEIERCAAVP